MERKQEVYKLKIDDEFRRIIPLLSTDERKLLEENIIKDGCRDAICVWNKTIIDGHNRYEICTKYQIPFEISYVFLRSREDAIAWICGRLLRGRNLTDESRRYLIGKRYEMAKIIGAHNFNGRNQHSKKEVNAKLLHESFFDSTAYRIRERLANEYKINHTTVQKYAYYANAIDSLAENAPKLYTKIMAGQLKMSQENIIEISRLSPIKIQRIGTQLPQNKNETVRYRDTRGIVSKNRSHKIQLAQMQIGAIKDMPPYDPDAEILSLALTVPSWVSYINRIRASANFCEITDTAGLKLYTELIELKAAIDIILSAVKEG